jgi:hypothetical protein
MTFTITTQPFYDQSNQCYKNILMINIEPRGPLRRLVRRIKLPRLSPFSSINNNCNNNYIQNCGLAIQNIANAGINAGNGYDLMSPNDIPNLISFLLANGYQIDTQLTNTLNLSLTNQRIVLTATYYGNSNQPTIVYMR